MAAKPENSTVDIVGRHIPALDAVRGVAILLVTLYRFRGPHDETVWGQSVEPILRTGGLGVDLFFVLSGFLITGILFDAKGQQRYFRNFYARRALRIFPLYYGVLLVSLALPLSSWAGADWQAASRNQVWLWTYSANLFIAASGEWGLGWFNHFWSLSVEEHFYFAWPMVIFWSSRKSAMWAAAAGAAASALARTLWLATGGDGVAAEVFTLFRLDGILAGAWLALAVRSPNGLARLLPWAKPLAACGAVMFALELYADKRWLAIPTTVYALAFCALMVLVIHSSECGLWGRLWRMPLLRHLGKYSYGMYVFQNPLLLAAPALLSVESWRARLDSSIAGGAAYLSTMFALTWLAALASWHLYEKQFLKLKQHFTPASKATERASPLVHGSARAI